MSIDRPPKRPLEKPSLEKLTEINTVQGSRLDKIKMVQIYNQGFYGVIFIHNLILNPSLIDINFPYP